MYFVWYLAKPVTSLGEFRGRFNNYSLGYRNYPKEIKAKQESFHAHFTDGVYSGGGDWEVKLTDQSNIKKDLMKRELIWQHEFHTFQPSSLDECDVALFKQKCCTFHINFYIFQ